MATIHAVVQGKGVGKTIIAALLVQYLQDECEQNTLCLDTDTLNGSLSAFAALEAKQVEIDDLAAYCRTIPQETAHVVIDTSTAGYPVTQTKCRTRSTPCWPRRPRPAAQGNQRKNGQFMIMADFMASASARARTSKSFAPWPPHWKSTAKRLADSMIMPLRVARLKFVWISLRIASKAFTAAWKHGLKTMRNRAACWTACPKTSNAISTLKGSAEIAS